MLAKAHRRGFGSFPLFKVLIVITITVFALLSLQSARVLPRQIVCGAHLRQWGVAFAIHADVHGGFVPHCDGLERRPLSDRRVTREDITDRHGWMDVVRPLIDHEP